MCRIGLFSYLHQAGQVKIHEQGTLSDTRYEELKRAQKMIKNYIKDSNYRVDIYDANTPPPKRFVYTKAPDSVYIEATNLLEDTVTAEEFYEKQGEPPIMRQIFRFIDRIYGVEEEPLERMKYMTKRRYNYYLKKIGSKLVK